MTIRDAQRGDLPAIVEIYNSIIPGRMVTADLDLITVESRVPWLEAHDPSRHPIWVVEANTEVVAWLSFDTYYPRAAYDGTAMVAIYVAESHRGGGIGRMLLARAIE